MVEITQYALKGRVGQNLRKFCRLFKNLANRFSFAVWLRQPTVLPIASLLFWFLQSAVLVSLVSCPR